MLYQTLIQTPIGGMLAIADNSHVIFLDFLESKNIDYLQDLADQHDIIMKKNKIIDCLVEELMEYFDGKRQVFSLPVKLDGTDFQKRTWEVLLKIAYGKTISYEEEAKQLHVDKGARAVANANGKNHIVILVPCHRVIAKDGSLAGYSSGAWRKEFLLNLEHQIQ